MTEMYRFRSVESLVGEYEELERQTIFFAAPGELNDPMEGFRDIVWTGDRIAWVNLFRDYVNCLHWSFHHLLVFGDEICFEPSDVRNAPPWNALPTPATKELSYAIWAQVRDRAQIAKFSKQLAAIRRKVKKAELVSYLRLVHVHALAAIRQAYIEAGLTAEDNWVDIPKFQFDLTALADVFDLFEQTGIAELPEAIFSVVDHMSEQNGLINAYNNRESRHSIVYQNKMKIVSQFPHLYVEELNRLLWPNWYAACFAKSYSNSSMWSHYGDKHRGVCLIFDAGDPNGGTELYLNQVTGWSGNGDGSTRKIWGLSPMAFNQVNYLEKPGEVDFFKSIGKLPRQALMDLWYTDESGVVSDGAAHLISSSEEHTWRDEHWDTFFRDITSKTKDWEYEQEYRLILHSMLADVLEETDRTLTYEFKSLKGIIFGMNMSDDDKQRIIEIIERKCRDNDRTDFQFYQAYYSPKDGTIDQYALTINFAGISEADADS